MAGGQSALRSMGIALAFAVNSTIASAASDYICEVKAAYTLSDGLLGRHPSSNAFEGKIFTVDRHTGQIEGHPLFSSSGWLGKKQVLDYGSRQQSFKMLLVTPPICQC